MTKNCVIVQILTNLTVHIEQHFLKTEITNHLQSLLISAVISSSAWRVSSLSSITCLSNIPFRFLFFVFDLAADYC